MNRLSYSETNDPRWSISMPTFLVDGWDLAGLLGVTARLHWNQVASVGAVEARDPFIYPSRTVYHRVSAGAAEVQSVLSIHLGDTIGHFVAMKVRAYQDRIEWSEFDSLPGVRMPLMACGPFEFARDDYISVLAPLCRAGLVDAEKHWSVKADAIDQTWAAAE